MLQSKTSAFVSLLLVFVSGGVVGTLVDRLYISTAPVVAHKQQQPPPDPEEVRKRIVNEMTKEVKLDDKQVQDFEKIMDDTREQWMQLSHKQNAEGQALRDSQVERIKAMLRPDQIPLYETLHAKHEAERKKKQQERDREHHKGPPPTEKPKSN
jgi:hypothetical protein